MTDRAERPRPPRVPSAAAAIGWVAIATLVVLGRRAPRPGAPAGPLLAPPGTPPPPTTAGSRPDSVARHAPVIVTSEWWHDPVDVVATPEDSAAAVRDGSLPGSRLVLPRAIAALRGFASPLIMPRLQLSRALVPSFPVLRGLAARARPNQPVQVTLTAYCLHGTTRQGTQTRPGVVAADPRIFPLLRHVHLFAAGRYLGRFRIEDTGGAVHGAHIDIWTPDCADAQRFGTRSGVASLVAFGD